MAASPTPTEGELAILRVLWAGRAPMTVREVHGELSKAKDTAYTTVLKMLTIMADKELPYKLLKKVMATSTAANYGQLSLAVLQKASDLAVVRVARN